jgi:inward rectifier potassium channel
MRKILDRRNHNEDIGLDRSARTGRQRTINPDGSFNIERKTGSLFGEFTFYHWLLTTPWRRYWFTAFGFYGVMNMFFALAYFLSGPDQLVGLAGKDAFNRFLYCFFFSVQSFTTVGYGGIYPVGKIANFIATIEAFLGLMTFALATGTLYGRFSKPVTRIKYSKHILIVPYNDITGLQFMVANELRAALMEVEAKVNISWSEEDENGQKTRRFQQVKLQIDKIAMFPTSWIVNHPIDEESALYGRTKEEIEKMDFEVFALLKGFDDVFSQTVYSRHSFMPGQFVFGARFKKPFGLNEQGRLVMDLTKVGEYEEVKLNVPEMAG